MKVKSGQKFIAVVVGMTALAALVVLLLIVPQATRLGDLGQNVSQAESDADAARTLLAQRQSIKARSAETETQLLRLANQLPESPELPSFILELQDVLNESGLEFTEIIPSEPVANEQGFDEISIQLRMSGEWADMVDVLQRLRRVVRQIRITNFQVTPLAVAAPTTPDGAETPGQENLLEAVLVIEIYTLSAAPPAAPPATEAAPAPTQP